MFFLPPVLIPARKKIPRWFFFPARGGGGGNSGFFSLPSPRTVHRLLEWQVFFLFPKRGPQAFLWPDSFKVPRFPKKKQTFLESRGASPLKTWKLVFFYKSRTKAPWGLPGPKTGRRLEITPRWPLPAVLHRPAPRRKNPQNLAGPGKAEPQTTKAFPRELRPPQSISCSFPQKTKTPPPNMLPSRLGANTGKSPLPDYFTGSLARSPVGLRKVPPSTTGHALPGRLTEKLPLILPKGCFPFLGVAPR